MAKTKKEETVKTTVKVTVQKQAPLNVNNLQLFNTLSRKKELFTPISKITPLTVGMYTCGPTVYNFAHIGNLRAYVFEDVLKRTLLFNGYKVKHVMNITDVGHLTSDADEGEDKMLKGAKREGKTVWEVAKFYTEAFQNDLRKMHILDPDIWCKATDHITEQIELIKRLEKKGHTYLAGGNVYFDTSILDDYGKLAQLNLNDLNAEERSQSRVEKDENKKHSHDFVLWFTKSKFQEQEMKWASPWGVGYPGWHIECSAMSMKYLGEQFDIHCGGIDHIPVHHTNEIAQTEAATGKKPWVKYWLHNAFLELGDKVKMAKSGDNFITLARVKERNLHPLDYRYFCLGTHYRNPLMFGWEALEGAKNTRRRLMEKVREMSAAKPSVAPNTYAGTKIKAGKVLPDYLQQFTSQINDDMNIPQTLATLWELVRDDKVKTEDKLATILKFDEVLGLGLGNIAIETIPAEIKALAEERLLARKNKDWKKSDELRQKIKELGYTVGDTSDGYEVKKD